MLFAMTFGGVAWAAACAAAVMAACLALPATCLKIRYREYILRVQQCGHLEQPTRCGLA